MSAKRTRGRRTPATDALSWRVVESALAEAEKAGWANVRLRRIAASLGVPLSEIHRRFRDQNSVADAWFARAFAAMLAVAERPGFARRPARQRLESLLLAWLDALAAHRRVTAAMIAVKLYPPHPHHWVPAIFSVSRLIQWLRDAAGFDAGGIRRSAEEIALTALFLGTLAVWARDGSPGQKRARSFLARALDAWPGVIAP